MSEYGQVDWSQREWGGGVYEQQVSPPPPILTGQAGVPVDALTLDMIGGSGSQVQAATVVGLQGRRIASGAPEQSQVLWWSGGEWRKVFLTGGQYGDIQYHNGSGFFGGYGEFWYNGNLTVGRTRADYNPARLNVGGNVLAIGDLDCAGFFWSKAVVLQGGPMEWRAYAGQGSRGHRAYVNDLRGDYRNNLEVYSTADTYHRVQVYSRNEMDASYAQSAANYYTKPEVYYGYSLGNRQWAWSFDFSTVPPRFYVDDLFGNYYTKSQMDQIFGSLSTNNHMHNVLIDWYHDHEGTVEYDFGHTHFTYGPIN